MIYEIRFRPEAENDIEDASVWYESQRQGLGHFFLNEVEKSLAVISENPLLYPVIYRNTRRAVIHKFPFAIFYRFEEREVIVFGIIHGSRSPQRWKARV
ncbi:MAG: type II toxin-antitoxin system RelE/ParE family toxin [Peptococcaceae bacterium]|nr:type II toxin-antitoxin system RelE/ParE family toxin [Peptococcaceae bacterium]